VHAQKLKLRLNEMLHRKSPYRFSTLRSMLLLTIAMVPAVVVQAEDRFIPIDIQRVHVEGEMGRRINATIEHNLLALDIENDFLQPFRQRTQSHGYIGLGKLLDSLVRFAAYSQDERLLALKEQVVAKTIQTQDADGYLGIMVPEARMLEAYDIHEMSYLIYGLVADYHYFGEESSLDAARKLANYVIRRWMAEPDKRPTWPTCILGIGSAMLTLHQQTDDDRYLKFCTEALQIQEWKYPVLDPGSEQDYRHAYAAMSRFLAQLRLSRIERDEEKLLHHSRLALDYLTNHDGLIITGTCSLKEQWHDTQIGTGKLGETCATAYLIRWLENWLCLEGDSHRGDIMERAIYNALFAAQSPDGRRLRYFCPFEGPREYFDKDSYCCPNNFRRIISELPGMIYYRSPGGVMVNLYTPSTATIKLDDDISLDLRQETDYPNTGKVVIHVSPSQQTEFSLQLRIPGWCSEASISVNGKPHGVAGPGFTTIERTWETGDKVELNMPMPWRLVRGRKAQANRVAVMRGPSLFCLNRKRHPELAGVDPKTLVLDPSSLEGPVADDSVRPNGIACRVRAWNSGANYSTDKTDFELTLTEFPDPDGVAVYFAVPNPESDQFVDDELNQH